MRVIKQKQIDTKSRQSGKNIQIDPLSKKIPQTRCLIFISISVSFVGLSAFSL